MRSREDGAPSTGPGKNESSKDSLSIKELYEILHRRRKLVWISWLVITVLAITVVMTRKPRYESGVVLVVAAQKPSTNTQGDSILTPLMALTQGRNTATQVEVLESPELIREAYARFTPAQREAGFKPSDEDDELNLPPPKAYKIENKEDTDAVDINVFSYDPKIGADFANSIAFTYLNRDLEQNNKSTKEAREYVEVELKRAKKSLADARDKVTALKNQTGLVTPDIQVTAEATRLWTPNIPFSTTIQENPNYILELGRLHDLETLLTQAQTSFTPNSPEVKDAEKRVQAQQMTMKRTALNLVGMKTTEANPVRQQLLGLLATEVANHSALESQLQRTTQIVNEITAVFSKYPKLQRDIAQAQLDSDTLVATYTNLYSQYYTLLVTEHSNLPDGIVVSKATPAPEPYFPKWGLTVVMSIFSGLLLAIGGAIMAERLDTRVHDPATVEAILGVSMLALVPAVANPDKSEKRPLIGSDSAAGRNHGLLEAFRTLRNNLYFLSPDKPARIIALTSASSSEGKTTTAINLAIALGLDGKRVLVIDTDLRRPAVASSLDLSRTVGLTTVVAARSTLADSIVATPYENMWILPAGPLPPNPTEFLNSDKCASVINECADLYDFVILDSPPTVGISDMQVISRMVDAVIIVVGSDRATRSGLEITYRTLYQVRAHVLGMVINRVEISRHGYGYYGYYNYYSYYAQEYGVEADGKGTKKRKRRKKKKES